MRSFSYITEILNISFCVGILEQHSSNVSVGEISFEDIYNFNCETQRLTPVNFRTRFIFNFIHFNFTSSLT